MAGIASGPPVLNTETYFVHPTFSKCEKRSLIARIQFFSGNIVHRMNDAQFIMLPQATSVASMTRAEVNRVRSSEMLEDHLKKKLGREYSTYLDLPHAESASEAESVSDPESDGASPRKPIKQFKKTNTRDLESPELNARPQPKRLTNKFTQTELQQLEEYVALHPPDENDNGKPNGSWWVKLCEDCEWARTHSHMSWRTWSCRHWNKWAKETPARRKALAKASGIAHLAKASTSRQKKVETIELSSSGSSSEGEGEEHGPQEIPEFGVVQSPRDNLEAPISNAKYDFPKPRDPLDVAIAVQRRDRPIDTETESTEEEDAPQPVKAPKQANQRPTFIVRPLSAPPPPRGIPPPPHLGFACWRRRPRVLVADSDPSQTTATTTTNTTQTTNPGPVQFTQLTSASAIPAAQKSRILTQSSASASQYPQTTQSQRSSQAASASGSGSGSSGRNPWIAPDAEDSDGDYNATRHTFDADSDDDGWSENSSENGTDDEEPEFLLTSTQASSGLPAATRKRPLSTLTDNDEGAGFRKLVDLHLPAYFKRAVLEYGAAQAQTQTQSLTRATQQSQSQSVTIAAGASPSRITLSSQQQQKRRRLVNAVLSLVSHWMQIPLPKVRNVWKSLPPEKRSFEELQKKCLQCDLSTSRKEYDATGLFTQQSPRSRVRKWGDGGGPARKRRRLETFPPLSRDESSNTEADFEDEDEESAVYFGGQDLDAPTGSYEDDGADQEPPPILFRQTRLIPGSAKVLHPYPAQPDKKWAKRICRVLAATYEWRKASKVYEIWKEVGGDARRVEKTLKETQKSLKDKSLGDQKTLLDLGLGDIPRPWV